MGVAVFIGEDVGWGVFVTVLLCSGLGQRTNIYRMFAKYKMDPQFCIVCINGCISCVASKVMI